MKKFAKKRGFSLIELLIVVVIIGVLAAMMMLASDEARISARAAAIISDFESIKTAATAYYLDNARKIKNGDWKGFTESENELEVWKYLSSNFAEKIHTDGDNTTPYKYSLGGGKGTNWYVWCMLHHEDRVWKKIYVHRNLLSLVGCTDKDGPHSTKTETLDKDSSKQHYVGMCILNISQDKE